MTSSLALRRLLSFALVPALLGVTAASSPAFSAPGALRFMRDPHVAHGKLVFS